MANNKDEDIEKEYTDLRLEYALENPEIKDLYHKCSEELDAFDKLRDIQYEKYKDNPLKTADGSTIIPYTDEIEEQFKKYEKLYTLLMDKLRTCGFPTGDIVAMKKNKPGSKNEFIFLKSQTIYAKAKWQDFSFRSPENNSKFRKILQDGFTKENEKWFDENYDKMKYRRTHDDVIETNPLEIDPIDRERKLIFNKKTKKFYSDFKLTDIFFEEDFLEDGRYLNLKIDLSRKRKDIEKNLKSILNYFWHIVYDSKSVVKKQQDIELYKRYLRVYRLIQEKGEKWTEIAKEVFPEEFISDEELLKSDSDDMSEPNRPSARTKVHNDYKEAKRLIREGLP